MEKQDNATPPHPPIIRPKCRLCGMTMSVVRVSDVCGYCKAARLAVS